MWYTGSYLSVLTYFLPAIFKFVGKALLLYYCIFLLSSLLFHATPLYSVKPVTPISILAADKLIGFIYNGYKWSERKI